MSEDKTNYDCLGECKHDSMLDKDVDNRLFSKRDMIELIKQVAYKLGVHWLDLEAENSYNDFIKQREDGKEK
jgi:hypothetical protein